MTTITSSEAQKRFGQIIDQARGPEVIVVERYGQPRVVILDYSHYERLMAGEQERLRDRLRHASAAATDRTADLTEAEVDQLIDEARAEAHAWRGPS